MTVRSLASALRTFSYSAMALGSLPCWTYFSAALRTFCLLNPKPNAISVRTPAPGFVIHPLIRELGLEVPIGRAISHLEDGLPHKANCTTGRHEPHGYQRLPKGSVRTGYQGHLSRRAKFRCAFRSLASGISSRDVAQTFLAGVGSPQGGKARIILAVSGTAESRCPFKAVSLRDAIRKCQSHHA